MPRSQEGLLGYFFILLFFFVVGTFCLLALTSFWRKKKFAFFHLPYLLSVPICLAVCVYLPYHLIADFMDGVGILARYFR